MVRGINISGNGATVTGRGVDVGPVEVIPDAQNLESAYIADELSLSDGDPVSTWPDSAGSFDATTSDDDPTFRENVINGLPVVSFDGQNDGMDTGFEQDTGNPHSRYFVYNLASSGDFQTFYGINANGRTYVGETSGDSYNIGWGDEFDNSGSSVNDQFLVLSTRSANGDYDVFENGSLEYSFSYGSTGLVGETDGIGYRKDNNERYADIEMAEILRYDVEHNDSTRQEVESYLADKYGITL